METIKAANRVIKEGIALLPDDAKKDFMAAANKEITVDEAINNACGALNGNEEKIAMLEAWTVQEANRVVTTLWRMNILPETLEAAYRAFPTMKEVADNYNKFVDARKARMDEVMAQHKVLAEEDKELQVFQGIVNGIAAEKAEKEYDNYQKAQQQAVAGGR